ncbi:hypothetical protein B5F37_13825 [Drancourtella sp. An210]|nr:hypothetical protein B5F37_13825 [Drancourtella sp. An210]
MYLNRKKISNIVISLILLLPILKYYFVPILNIGFETVFYAIITGLLVLLKVIVPHPLKQLGSSRNAFLCFALWCIFLNLFISLMYSIDEAPNMLINIVIPCLVIVLLMSADLDFSGAFSIYTFAIYVILAVFFFQHVLYIFGLKLSFKVPFFSFTSAWEYLNTHVYFGMRTVPTALFCEPAHLAEYIVPYLAICLSMKDKSGKIHIKRAVLLTIVLAMSTSGNGIISGIIVWVLYFALNFTKEGKYINMKVVLLSFAFVIIAIIVYLNSESIRNMFDILFVNKSGGSYTKANYRIYRGFDYFLQLPWEYIIFGVGLGNMNYFSRVLEISSVFDSDHLAFEFFSMITQILLYFGLIGFFLFGLHMMKLWLRGGRTCRVCIVASVAIWFSSQMLFTSTHIFYLLIILFAFVTDGQRKEFVKNG